MNDEDPFIKVSVHLLDNHKVMNLSAKAFRLYVVSIVASGRALSDGQVKVGSILGACDANWRQKRELVDADLWHEAGHECERCPQPLPPLGRETYIVIHDYLRYQQSRADVQKRREAKSKAGKAGAIARWGQPDEDETLDGVAGAIAPANATANGRKMAERWPEPEPEVVPAQSPNQARVLPLYPPDF